MLRYGSVCSGIEAASVAWHILGWKPVFFSEIEKFPCAVLAHHYPKTPNLGDMTKFEEWPDATLDVLVGGTPCQSFSVAGLRKGLDDPRGNLMLTFGAIARRYRPEWLVWENVPGVLSSNGGRDFGTFLGMLGELGYGFAYRVLDAQFFGVAQRRRRVFVVGCLGDWRRAAAVLFEQHSLSGHPAPSRKTGKVAPTIPSRSSGGGGLGTDFDCDGGLIHADPIARCVTAGEAKRQDWETCNFVAQSFAIQVGALRTNPTSGPDGVGVQADHAYTLEARTEVQAVAFDTTQITSAANYSNPKPGDPCHPLASGAHPPAIAHVHVAPTMRAGGNLTGGHRPPGADVDTVEMLLTDRLMQVRRLTPRECARLQGFPDEYLDIQYRGKPAADGPKYKALGNSMAVPVMRWIGERIDLAEGIAQS